MKSKVTFFLLSYIAPFLAESKTITAVNKSVNTELLKIGGIASITSMIYAGYTYFMKGEGEGRQGCVDLCRRGTSQPNQ